MTPRLRETDTTQMTSNKRTVETYMDGFRRTDRRQILSCLTQDAVLTLAFCDIFEMQNGKIRRLVSYLVPTN